MMRINKLTAVHPNNTHATIIQTSTPFWRPIFACGWMEDTAGGVAVAPTVAGSEIDITVAVALTCPAAVIVSDKESADNT
jgi:hypothetical protein